ncbi:bifunctional riboflavin kinase/FAD synthetase [Aquirufa sp. ROCK2-A2]
MKVYHSFSAYNEQSESVVSIGMFDGVHIGHRKVIQHCVDLAKENDIQSIIISFSNHPSSYFTQNFENNLLTSAFTKIELIKDLNVDVLFLIPFDEFIATISAIKFVEDILIDKLNCTSFVLGYDNRFGFKREGSIQFIQNNFKTQIQAFEVEAEKLDEIVISSTTIKEYIAQGQIEIANKMLGRNFSVDGKVVKGNQLGRTIDFPTANIELANNEQFLPSLGVYLTEVIVQTNKYYGLTNVGIRPTVSELNEIKIETFIFDFNEDIYGTKIKLNFISKCRNEIKFSNLESLKYQISQDVEWAKNELTKIHVTS